MAFQYFLLGFFFRPRPGLGIAGTRLKDQPPQPPRFIAVAALLGQGGEVAPGQMAVDALIDAAKLVRSLQGQDPPPAGFGLGRLASFAMQDGLAEVNLGVVGVEPQALGAGDQGGRQVAEHLVEAGDQGE